MAADRAEARSLSGDQGAAAERAVRAAHLEAAKPPPRRSVAVCVRPDGSRLAPHRCPSLRTDVLFRPSSQPAGRASSAGWGYDRAMGSLLRLLLIGSALVLVALMILRPAQMRRLGQRARVVAYAYVAAIVISAVLRLAFGWGT